MYIDEHRIELAAPPAVVFDALSAYVSQSLLSAPRALTSVLDPSPPGGFAIASSVPGRSLELVGSHRFAQYRLEFTVGAVAGGSVLTARSYGTFPGLRGRVYRALVVGSGGHVLAVRHMLREVAARVG